ncbi:MAG: enoyl-CoA hydratase [Gammaproteobacteria bacterium]|nr:enoyl-CoA hydratase [Rhodospirillaceae bacterium]MDE0365092.1 enoyl-CoA hydratase [Gammaproteobacteria bacterium]
MNTFKNLVLVASRDGIAEVTLNRPKAMNALSADLQARIAEVFESLQEDESVEVVILTGAGRAFCAGLDLKEIGGEVEAGRPRAPGNMLRAIGGMTRPIIGAINGYAVTGGFELALMCDILIASTEARFADTHARVAVVPGWGLSQRLPRLIGISRAKELSLTGNYLDAATACEWGLVNRVTEPEALLPAARSIAADICSTDRRTRTTIKRIMDEGWNATLEHGLETERGASRAQGISADFIRRRRKSIQARARAQQASTQRD